MYSINSAYGHCGWMFGVSTAFVLSMECLGLDFWGVHSICSLSGTCKLLYLFIYLFSCGVACSVYGALVVTAFCSAHEAFGLVRFHGAFRVPGTLGLWGGGPLWRSQRLYWLGNVGVGCFCGFHST